MAVFLRRMTVGRGKICSAVLLFALLAFVPSCSFPVGDNHGAGAEVKEEAGGKRLVSVPDIAPYMTLPKVEGRSFSEEPTQEEVETYAREKAMMIGGLPSEDGVKEGDTVLMNYVVHEGFEIAEAGLANNYLLTVGSGEMEAGFEEALLGMKAGETRFFALGEVEVQVTVQAVYAPVTLSEEWATGQGYESLSAFMDGAKDELLLSYKGGSEAFRGKVFETLLSEAEVLVYPEEDLEEAGEDFSSLMERYSASANMDTDTFLSSQGLTGDALEAGRESYAKKRVAEDLLLQGLMDELGISLEDAAAKKAEERLAKKYAEEDVEDLYQSFGERNVLSSVAYERVMDTLLGS